jgi:hypothetical protein
MSAMFEVTKAGAKVAFAATMIREENAKNGFFKNHDGRVHLALERDSLLSAISNMDGKETVTIETSYDELIRHAAATQKHHPLGFINIDKFSPSFSW